MTTFPETQHYFMHEKRNKVIQHGVQQGPICHREDGAREKNTVYDERQRIWPICYYLAYLNRVHSGYNLVFLLPVHHTYFHRAVELVNYIHVFLIVSLVCNSLYKCSTYSIVPNYRQLKRRNIFFCYCKQGMTFVIMRAQWCLNIKVVINYLNDTTN